MPCLALPILNHDFEGRGRSGKPRLGGEGRRKLVVEKRRLTNIKGKTETDPAGGAGAAGLEAVQVVF